MPKEDEEAEDDGEKQTLPLKGDGTVDYEEIERQYRVKYPPRELNDSDRAVIDELWRRKLLETDFEAISRGDKIEPAIAYCTTTAEVQMSKWNGQHPPEKNTRIVTIPAGKTLKIVMVSRFEEFGLTNDLTSTHGYGLRLPWDDARIINLRWEP